MCLAHWDGRVGEAPPLYFPPLPPPSLQHKIFVHVLRLSSSHVSTSIVCVIHSPLWYAWNRYCKTKCTLALHCSTQHWLVFETAYILHTGLCLKLHTSYTLACVETAYILHTGLCLKLHTSCTLACVWNCIHPTHWLAFETAYILHTGLCLKLHTSYTLAGVWNCIHPTHWLVLKLHTSYTLACVWNCIHPAHWLVFETAYILHSGLCLKLHASCTLACVWNCIHPTHWLVFETAYILHTGLCLKLHTSYTTGLCLKLHTSYTTGLCWFTYIGACTYGRPSSHGVMQCGLAKQRVSYHNTQLHCSLWTR